MIGNSTSHAAWKGASLDWRQDGLYQLSAPELAEIDAALVHLRGLGDLDFLDITAARFPLPQLGDRKSVV